MKSNIKKIRHLINQTRKHLDMIEEQLNIQEIIEKKEIKIGMKLKVIVDPLHRHFKNYAYRMRKGEILECYDMYEYEDGDRNFIFRGELLRRATIQDWQIIRHIERKELEIIN